MLTSPRLKFYVGLVGVLATAGLGSFGPDSTVAKILTLVVALATAAGVYLAQNSPAVVDPLGEDLSDPNADVESS